MTSGEKQGGINWFRIERLVRPTIAQRLRMVEEALEGHSHGAPTRMARRLGIGVSRWDNVKSGRGLSMQMQIILLTRIPGLSADWLLLGRPDGLSYEMAQLLGIFNKVH